MKNFQDVISETLTSFGFPVVSDNNEYKRYYIVSHKEIPNFSIRLRFWTKSHCRVEVNGQSIKSSRVIDYYDNDKSVKKLKSRLKRLISVALKSFRDSQSSADQARAYKAEIAEQIKVVNESRYPNHDLVIDQDELEDDYKHLTVYYRQHELSPRLDEDGVVVLKETLFNKSKELTLNQAVNLIDILVN